MQHANCGSLEEENDQRRARRVIPGVIDRESAQRAAAREEPGVREHESAQRAAARATRTFDMACKYVDGKYIFHQTCGYYKRFKCRRRCWCRRVP